MKFNPYHQWLGLDPRLKSPHHFQLLGVSSTVGDAKLFRSQVKAAAQAKLEMLAGIDDEETSEIREQLRARILQAEKVLSSEKLRHEYLTRLKLEISTKKPKPNPSGKPARNPPKALDLPSENDISSERTLISPALPPVGFSVPMAHPTLKITSVQDAEFDSSIPMAIPVGRQSLPTSEGEATRGAMSDPDDRSNSDPELPIRLKPVRKKKKSQWALIFYSSILFLMVLISGMGLYLIFDRLIPPPERLSDGAVATNSTAPATISSSPSDESATPHQALAVDSWSGNSFEPDSLEPDTSSDISSDAVSADAESSVGDSVSSSGFNLQTTLEQINSKDWPPVVISEERLKSIPNIEDRIKKVVESDPVELNQVELNQVELNQVELREMRWQLQRVRRGLRRRDMDSAFRTLADLDRRVNEWLDSENSVLIPAQQRLIAHLEATLQAMMLIDGFWKQVRVSSVQISGGQEIRLNDQVLGFVEDKFEGVMLRNAGSNIMYEYEFMLPGLAVALAEQGAIPDIPTWRMQQAAFFILCRELPSDFSERIDDLVAQSVADGHDETMLREFANSDLSDVIPNSSTSFPAVEKIAELEAELQSEFDYKGPERVKPEVAANLLVKLIDSYPVDDAERSIVLMEQIRKLAIRAGDVYRVDDAISELIQITTIEKTGLYLDSFLELGQQKMSAIASRRLMETAIPFLKTTTFSEPDSRKKTKLIQMLIKLAEKHGFADSQRRLSQIE